MAVDLKAIEERANKWKQYPGTQAVNFLMPIQRDLFELIAEVRRLEKENDEIVNEIVDDALRCAQICDKYKERLASAEDVLRQIQNSQAPGSSSTANSYFQKWGEK